jgi:hypothetical protein
MIVERDEDNLSLMARVHDALARNGWRLHKKIDGPPALTGAPTALFCYLKVTNTLEAPSAVYTGSMKTEQLFLQVYEGGSAVELFGSVTFTPELADLLMVIEQRKYPMRERAEVQRLHDLLLGMLTMKGAIDGDTLRGDFGIMITVLCWILRHDDGAHSEPSQVDRIIESSLEVVELRPITENHHG